MCGIVGVLTDSKRVVNSPTNSFFQQALFVDTMRGFDSTGVAAMTTNMDKPDIYKKALTAPDYLQLSGSIRHLDESNGWNVMIGHNRAATKGGVKDHTSHPFQIGNITLVHNGTLTRHNNLPEGNNFNVDSEAITNAINTVGIEEVAGKMDGAFSLVWHDAEDNTVNFFRNKERPMYIGLVEGGGDVLFASESGMLQWLAHRNGLKVDKVFATKEGVQYSYQVGVGKHWASSPVTDTLKMYEPSWYSGYRNSPPKKYEQVKDTSKDSSAILAKLNLVGEMDVTFVPKRFQPYSVKTVGSDVQRGQVFGTIAGEKKEHDVIIYNLTEAEWKTLSHKFVIGTIQNTFMRDDNIPTIVVNKQNYITYDLEGLVDNKDEVTDLDDAKKLYRGPRGSYVELEAFDKLTKEGCAVCQDNIFEDDAEEISWTEQHQPVCTFCSNTYGWGSGELTR